jgi:hypothetical protein
MPSKTPPKADRKKVAPPAPAHVVPPPAPRVRTIEERTSSLEARLMAANPAFLRDYRDNLDMSWVYHDSAIEGVVYTVQELKTAIDPSAVIVTDSNLQPACEEIRRHREALNFIRDFAVKKRLPVTLDVVKKIYLILHPEEGDLKTLRYRKDIPQHRLYFHEYAPPDKITYKVRQVMDWVNDPETRRTRNAIRGACALRPLAHLPVHARQREGRAAADEPAAPSLGLPPGDHPLDRAAALLRRPEGGERRDEPDRPGGHREQPGLGREAGRELRAPGGGRARAALAGASRPLRET